MLIKILIKALLAFFFFFRHEAASGEAAHPGGQRPHALGPRVLGRQVDPNHDVPVRVKEHC